MTTDLTISPEEAVRAIGVDAKVFGDRVYPVRSPGPSEDPVLVYAMVGETRETVYSGSRRIYTSFRLEVHAREYKALHAADRALVAALQRSGRLHILLTVLDDFSSGIQPVQRTDFGNVAIETADQVYRRIRSVGIA